MRLELEYPFNERWKIGYLIMCPDGRRRVFLYNSHNDRAGLSYARYLMCVHLKRLLDKDEHVDHKDEDKSNDVIDNLQILTNAENNRKNAEWKLANKGLQAWIILQCPICDEPFTKRGYKVQRAMEKNVVITCSKRCSAKHQVNIGRASLTNGQNRVSVTGEQHAMIVELRIEAKSDYVISEMIGLSRAKIQRYRKEQGIA